MIYVQQILLFILLAFGLTCCDLYSNLDYNVISYIEAQATTRKLHTWAVERGFKVQEKPLKKKQAMLPVDTHQHVQFLCLFCL